MKKYLNYPVIPKDYQTVCIETKDIVYSFACIVYKSTVPDWQLHLYDPSSATAKRIEIESKMREPGKWIVSEPIELSKYGCRHILRYNDGRHGLFAFSTYDRNAVFYVRELAFFITYEDAKNWIIDKEGVPHPNGRYTSIMLDCEENLEKNGMLYENIEPYKTGNCFFSKTEQALTVTYTAEDYITGGYSVGHWRLAPRFVKSKSNMLYLNPRHEHTSYEISAVLSGACEITVRGKIFVLEAGQLVFIPKNYFHIYRSVSDAPLKMVTVHFEIPNIETGVSKAVTMRQKEIELLKLLCDDMQENCSGALNDLPAEMSATSQKLFEVFFEYVMTNGYDMEPLVSRDTVIFRNAVRYMKNNLQNKLNVKEITAECAVCKTTLNNVFEKFVQMGCMKYFTVLKMERARQLLLSGKSCYEVSKELGYPSQAYFSKRFKLHFGVVPSNVERRM